MQQVKLIAFCFPAALFTLSVQSDNSCVSCEQEILTFF